MDLYESIEKRRSVRNFTSDPVPRDVLERLIRAASHAPSTMNSQPWRFHVATGETRERVTEAMSMCTVHLQEYIDILPPEKIEEAERFFASLGNAPVVMCVSVPNPHDDLDRINTYVATGCALQNLMLAATDEGYSTCAITFSFWVRDNLAEILGISDDREIISILVLGHPAEQPVAPPHNPDIASYYE